MAYENPYVKQAIAACGNSQSGLARRIGGKVRQGHVWKWLRSKKLSGEVCVYLELATDGQLRREQMRPDIFGQLKSAA